MSLVVAGLVLMWVIIIVTHLKFRKAKQAEGKKPAFPAPFSPSSNYVCIAFMVLITVVLYLTPSVRVSVYALPVWVAAVYVMYRLRKGLGARGSAAVSQSV
jgi:aromatic amino acid transport protein AroP